MTRTLSESEIPHYAAHALRFFAMDAVEITQNGHPGMPMGMADIATVLWHDALKHNPANPKWLNRDRFVLSNGHGSMLLYGLLHLTGYGLTTDDLKKFRTLHSRTPGHPEYGEAPGVEVTTGPLGQGISNAVGMALAERHLAARFNRPKHELIDHYTYAFAGDGCLQEGVSHESGSLAGHLGLGKLIVFYDDNGITIDGPTSMSFTENVQARYKAYGWHVQAVDGHNPEAIAKALKAAQRKKNQPSLIACKTVIGWGAPNKAGSHGVHGSPLGMEEVRATREALNWTWPPFEIPPEVERYWSAAKEAGAKAEASWNRKLRAYKRAFPAEGAELERIANGQPSSAWQEHLATLKAQWLTEPPKENASRAYSGEVLNALVPANPDMMGGSADLTGSNNTQAKGQVDVLTGDFAGSYMRYGVREHGMGAVMSGMALHGGVVPYSGTFLCFSDYMRPSIRLAALMGIQVVYVFTHDSIGLGMDGPTHQPVEHYAALRAIPNLLFIRPADARETLEAWEAAMHATNRPTALSLSRQKIPHLAGTGQGGGAKGAYVLAEPPEGLPLQAVLMGTGSEVQIALEAQKTLAGLGVGARVVSMPCWELFEEQPQSYREEVMRPDVAARVAVEAGVRLGWEAYLGRDGIFVGMSSFGASAPDGDLYQHFGITAENVVNAVKQQMR